MDDFYASETVTIKPEVMSPAALFSTQTIALVSLGLALFVIAVILLSRRGRRSSKGDSVLLLGSSDAGKTAILSTLVYKQTLHTHTSMQTNSAVVALPLTHKTLRLIDVPGHPRLRDQYREHLPEAKAVAFIVDASTISRVGPAVAEHLHQVMHSLTSLPPSQTPPDLLIVAHKCDLLKATNQATPEQLAINRVRAVLERELEKRKASHAGGVGVESMGAEDGESEMGGLECAGTGEFRFADWEGGEVAFVGTSVAVGKPAPVDDEKHAATKGLSSLTSWLEDP